MTATKEYDLMAILAAVPHRFTVAEYHRMAEVGVLTEDDRVELIEGEIVEMSPIGSRHSASVTVLKDIFHACGIDAVIWVQCPIQLPRATQPQPDLALLKPRADRYAANLPVPEDVLLVIEVADSSLVYDRDTKARLYAEAGIQEYWLVDLTRATLWVHKNPAGSVYASVSQMFSGDAAKSMAFPNCSIPVAELFP